jgi:CBS-domain-containing membrane protein
MNAVIQAGDADRLRQLTAQELINGETVVLQATATMNDAAHVLAKHSIGIAPVVDEDGCCIGVLSPRDFLAFEIDRTGDVGGDARAANLSNDGAPFVPCMSVQRYMSTAVQTIASNTRLKHIIEVMLGSRIHHLVVLDAQSAPLGVVSTLDVLAAVNAIDDEQHPRVGHN